MRSVYEKVTFLSRSELVHQNSPFPDFQKKNQEIPRLFKIYECLKEKSENDTSKLQLDDNIVLLGPSILWNVCVVPVLSNGPKICAVYFLWE